MVKITNGVEVFEVTRGAFDGIYSRQGFHIYDKNEKATMHNDVDAHESNENMSKDEIFAKEILEKPISQWNKDQVKRFASIKGIDISGTKNANEAKEIIKNVIDGI